MGKCLTTDEICANQQITDMDQFMALAGQAMVVLDHLKKTAKTETAGNMQCPACNGTISWGTVGRKRHLRAVCETANCIQIME